ncbi:MAG: NAD(P)-binding domain-containing protein [Proteobacteria bacterium]|nr:NAD(P)-binding domain-containing protein [Pseudomonadota bacterium]
MLEVAILGAGVSGLTCAAAALREGLKPTVLEKFHDIGGVWRLDSPQEIGGAAWPGMELNNTRFTGTFSDFSWPAESPDFPTALQMYHYLSCYADHFKLRSHLHFGCHVRQVQQQETKWKVTWLQENCLIEKYFDAVLVATGKYSNFKIPDFAGLDSISDKMCHAAQYRQPDKYKGKKVLVVGGSLSGTAITEELSNITTVIHLIRRARWLLPRRILSAQHEGSPRIPFDFLETQANNDIRLSPEEKYNKMLRFCEKQNVIPEWQMTPQSSWGVAIADEYVENVLHGKIKPYQGEINCFAGNKVILKDGNEIEFDAVIFCTGYEQDLSFLSQEIQNKLKAGDLYEDIFDDSIDNFGFIGNYPGTRGAVTPIVQLQAELACKVIAGKITLPEPAKRKAHIAQTPKLRTAINYMNTLATILGNNPAKMPLNLREKYTLNYGIFTCKRFRLTGSDCDPQVTWREINNDEKYRRKLIHSKEKVPTLAKLCKQKISELNTQNAKLQKRKRLYYLLRYFVGIGVVGPIAGLFKYMLNLKAIILAGVATGIALILLPTSAWFPICFGIMCHAAMSLYQTFFLPINSPRIDSPKTTKKAIKLIESEGNKPIPKAMLFGFRYANRFAGKDNEPYGKKAWELCQSLEEGKLCTSKIHSKPL